MVAGRVSSVGNPVTGRRKDPTEVRPLNGRKGKRREKGGRRKGVGVCVEKRINRSNWFNVDSLDVTLTLGFRLEPRTNGTTVRRRLFTRTPGSPCLVPEGVCTRRHYPQDMGGHSGHS